MSKVVFVLGAGASKEAGGPLMNEFVDRAEDILHTDKARPHTSDFKDVLAALYDLRRTQGKAKINTNNIEDVFAGFEMARLLGRLGERSQEELDNLVTSIKWVLVKTLSEEIPLYVRGGPQNPWSPPYPFPSFGDLLEKIGTPVPALITFNYDLSLDVLLHDLEVLVDYGLGNPPKLGRGPIYPLLKLHGSLNWTHLENGDVFPWPIDAFLTEMGFPARINLGDETTEWKPCVPDYFDRLGQPLGDSAPVIVPPTWNKGVTHLAIQSVWRRAAHELAGAEYIYVLGYSLAESDFFFRYLYALGTLSPARIRRFIVFDPNPQDVRGRYLGLLGPELPEPSRFEVRGRRFSQAIGELSALY